MTTKKDPKDEGPKGFNTTLAELDKGALHADASAELQRITAELVRQAATYSRDVKGELILKLSIDVAAGGATAHVRGQVETKAPKIVRPGAMFFVTPGSNLSVKNPAQTELPLHVLPDVPKADDPSAPNQPVQSV